MASLTFDLPEQEDEKFYFRPRQVDRLPAHVKGTAFWVEYQAPTEHRSCLHIEAHGTELPVELINNTWYLITWDYDKKEYYTRKQNSVGQGAFGLGYWKITDTQHPNFDPDAPAEPVKDVVKQSAVFSRETTPEEPASTTESTSDEPTPQRMTAPSSVITLMREQQRNPFELLAYEGDDSGDAPAVIASTTTTQISRTLTTQPGGSGGGPSGTGGGPPAGGGGGPPAGGPPAGGGAAPAPQNGGLKGANPENFDGTRTTAEKWWRQFTLWKLINRNTDALGIPANRILMALSYMRGPKVDDWVQLQVEWLEGELQQGRLPAEEGLWTDFSHRFAAAFTDTAKAEEATTQLLKLKMDGEDLDSYTATFENLRARAGWERDAKGTIRLYRQGLKLSLHRAILERTQTPLDTMDEWQEAARKQHSIYLDMKANLYGDRGPPPRNKGRWRQALGITQGVPRKKNRGPDDMDIDAIKSEPLDPEKQKLAQEGRCFFCKKQGHRARFCPEKKKGDETNRPKVAKARATDMESVADSEATCVTDTPDSLARSIKQLDQKQKTALLDQLCLDEEEGF